MVVESLLYPGLQMRIRKISILELILIFLSLTSQMMETQKIISKKLNRRTKCWINVEKYNKTKKSKNLMLLKPKSKMPEKGLKKRKK